LLNQALRLVYYLQWLSFKVCLRIASIAKLRAIAFGGLKTIRVMAPSINTSL